MRTLNIWWDGHLVGHRTQNPHGELGFAYAPDWLAREDKLALSASLPKRAAPIARRECRPFFGGLLWDLTTPRSASIRAVALAPIGPPRSACNVN